MGRSWYEDEGKYLTKMNTFNDFADCASYLQRVGMSTSEQIAVVGRSAGGLLIGAGPID
jgi:oligopeptidase B